MATHVQRGDVALSHDNLADARKEYEAALKIAESLVRGAPDNPTYKRDLWVSYNKVGEVLQVGGDLKGSREAFEATRSSGTCFRPGVT